MLRSRCHKQPALFPALSSITRQLSAAALLATLSSLEDKQKKYVIRTDTEQPCLLALFGFFPRLNHDCDQGFLRCFEV